MYSIFKQKEVSLFFNSLVGYIVIAVFLVLTGLMFWIYPQTKISHYGYAEMDNFFDIAPYVFLFLIPAVTMRMFSEEAGMDPGTTFHPSDFYPNSISLVNF